MNNKTHGQIGYEAYCSFTNWKSLVSGANLPQWDKLPDNIKQAWEKAGSSIVTNFIEHLACDTLNNS